MLTSFLLKTFCIIKETENKLCYLYPKRFFSFCFFLTTSIFRSFQVLFLSLIGRLPIYFPENRKREITL